MGKFENVDDSVLNDWAQSVAFESDKDEDDRSWSEEDRNELREEIGERDGM